jgi:hypothetical protein
MQEDPDGETPRERFGHRNGCELETTGQYDEDHEAAKPRRPYSFQARAEKKKLREFDLRADSHEAALAEMQNHFPAYQFLGTWPRGLRDFCTVRSVFSEKKKLSVAALSRTCRGSLLTPGEPWRVRISHQKRERTA